MSIRFSSPVSRLSTAENCPVTPIAARTASGSRGRRRARRPGCVPPSARDQRRQDVHHRGLAGAVGAEEREDRPLGDVEVDAVEHELVAVRLAQAGALRSRDASVIAAAGSRCCRATCAPAARRVLGGRRGRVGGLERVVHAPRGRVDVEPRRGALGEADLDVADLRLEHDRAARDLAQPHVAVRGLGDDAGLRLSTAMLPLAALSRSSPSAAPTWVSPLEFLITALQRTRGRARRPSRR